MFEKRHYKVIADILKEVVECYWLKTDDTVDEFVNYFNKNETNFDEEKFRKATGGS